HLLARLRGALTGLNNFLPAECLVRARRAHRSGEFQRTQEPVRAGPGSAVISMSVDQLRSVTGEHAPRAYLVPRASRGKNAGPGTILLLFGIGNDNCRA